MLVQKQYPIGIDVYVQAHQNGLHEHLLTKWGINQNRYFSIERVYANRSTTGYVPEYKYEGNDYKDALLTDKYDVQSFYGMDNTTTVDGKTRKVNVWLILFVNLTAIPPYKGKDGRCDEEVRNDVDFWVRKNLHGFEYLSMETGIERVFSEYPGLASDGFKTKCDMHPWHCFRINMQCVYDPLKYEPKRITNN